MADDYAFACQLENLSINSKREKYQEIMTRLKSELLKDEKVEVDGTFSELVKFRRRGINGDEDVVIDKIINPLQFSWDEYVEYYIYKIPRDVTVLFVGMSPSMDATFGIPFCDQKEFWSFWNIPRPVENEGDDYISGRRFWKLINELFPFKSVYQNHCFVMNCNPLIFRGNVVPCCGRPGGIVDIWLEELENVGPDNLVARLMQKCDRALGEAVFALNPKLIVAMDCYADAKVTKLIRDSNIQCTHIQHPADSQFEDDYHWINTTIKALGNGIHGTICGATSSSIYRNRDQYEMIMTILKSELLKNELVEADGTFGEFVDFTGRSNEEDDARRKVVINRIINPLYFSWDEYVKYYINKIPRKVAVLFVGMNPSKNTPFGIPFCDKEEFWSFWNLPPPDQILGNGGNDCVSGRRFWKFVKSFFSNRWSDYKDHCLVMNCSPLIFVESVKPLGDEPNRMRNVSLENVKKPKTDSLMKRLMDKSDHALEEAIQSMCPEYVVTFGEYACKKVIKLVGSSRFPIKLIEHPASRSIANDEDWILNTKVALGDGRLLNTIEEAKRE